MSAEISVDDILLPNWQSWVGGGAYSDLPSKNLHSKEGEQICVVVDIEGVHVYKGLVKYLNTDIEHVVGDLLIEEVELEEEVHNLGYLLSDEMLEECRQTLRRFTSIYDDLIKQAGVVLRSFE